VVVCYATRAGLRIIWDAVETEETQERMQRKHLTAARRDSFLGQASFVVKKREECVRQTRGAATSLLLLFFPLFCFILSLSLTLCVCTVQRSFLYLHINLPSIRWSRRQRFSPFALRHNADSQNFKTLLIQMLPKAAYSVDILLF
jgi:hypothetical protein